MERKGEKPTPRIVITEEKFVIPADAVRRKDRKVVAEIPLSSGATLEEVVAETYECDIEKVTPVTKSGQS